MDEPQDGGNFLIYGALLYRSVEKNTHIGMPSTTATDGGSLYSAVMEVVDNFGLEGKIVGITSDGGGNLWVCREALELKYTNDSVFFTQAPIHHGVPCTYISRGLQGESASNQGV